MGQLFLIAIRNLAQHRRRSLLLGGAIAGVCALLVLLLCLTSGVNRTMVRSATTLSSGHVNVGGFYKITAGQSAPVVTGYRKVMEVVKQALPDLDYVVARGRGWSRLVSESGSMQVGIAGVDIKHEPGLPKVVHVTQGKLEDLAQPGTILLFQTQAKKLDVKVGDVLTFSAQTPRGTANTLDVRVVAVAEDLGLMSSFNVFIPDVSLRQLYMLNDDATGALMVYLKDMSRIPQAEDKLRKALAAAGYTVRDPESKAFWQKFDATNREDWTGQQLDVTNWEDETSFVQWAIKALNGLTVALVAVLMVIIAVGIMNSMWIAIRERTREIGTLRAIGMQRRRVLAMFVIETFCLGALSSTAGAILGLMLAGLLHAAHLPVPVGARIFLMSETVQFAVEPLRIFRGMFIITLCTTLVSVIPSLYAARLQPVTAMQQVNG